MRRLTFALSLAGFLALAASARADDKCTVATKGDSPVAKACAGGGRKEAAKTMKGLVRTAKEKGTKFTCESCHKNTDDYQLKSNAKDDFKKLLELAGGAK